MKIIRKIYDWMGAKAQGPFGILWLIGFFIAEASFFIIPVDPLLILFCIQKRSKALYFATIATISSVVGGIFGYLIGYFLWDIIGLKLVTWFISEATFAQVVEYYKHYEMWAVLIAGFTPIPYKAVTLSAGFCHLPLIPFIIYSLISRGARFYLVGGAIYLWGEAIKQFIDRYFNYLVIAFTIIVILSCSFISKSAHL